MKPVWQTITDLAKQGHKLLKRKGGNVVLTPTLMYVLSRYLRPGLSHALQETTKEGMTLIDVGANIGYYSLLVSQMVGPSGKVFAFEPDPAHFRRLCLGIKKNRRENIQANSLAVGARDQEGELFLSTENSSDHRVYPVPGRRSLPVKLVSLDSFLKSVGSPSVDLVKIDVQGYEPFVVDGMQDLITGNRRLQVFSEFWPAGIESVGRDPEEYLRGFERAGFRLAWVREGQSPLERSVPQLLHLAEEHSEIDLVFAR